jgi:N-hydroxyarylamine O-acetyltransferase
MPTAAPALDLAAYLRRIGHAGPAMPDLATLEALVARHAASIPFENLDPLLGRTPGLDLASLQRKLIDEGRGGYCFEHNTLLQHALEAIGFSVTPLAARVLWNQPPDAITTRSHMLLRVALPDGPRLVDVGFGGLTLTGVLRLGVEGAQPTPHEPFRLVEADGHQLLQALVKDEWRTTYRFDFQPQYPIDFEVTNHYLATHPASRFRQVLMAARAASDARYGLMNAQLSIHRPEGSETRTIADAAELRAVLQDLFHLRVPEDPALDEALARVLAPTSRV